MLTNRLSTGKSEKCNKNHKVEEVEEGIEEF
jgi:hypothetical protein